MKKGASVFFPPCCRLHDRTLLIYSKYTGVRSIACAAPKGMVFELKYIKHVADLAELGQLLSSSRPSNNFIHSYANLLTLGAAILQRKCLHSSTWLIVIDFASKVRSNGEKRGCLLRKMGATEWSSRFEERRILSNYKTSLIKQQMTDCGYDLKLCSTGGALHVQTTRLKGVNKWD